MNVLVTVKLRTWLLNEMSRDIVVIIVVESSIFHAHRRYVDVTIETLRDESALDRCE